MATRDGRIRVSPSSSVKLSISPTQRPSAAFRRRAPRARRESARKPARVSPRDMQDQGALAGAGGEEHVVDLGGVLRLHRQVRCHPQLRLGRRLARRLRDGARGNFIGDRHALTGILRLHSEPLQDLGRRGRIDREPRPHRRARRVVDLIDQTGVSSTNCALRRRCAHWSERRDRSARAAEWGGYRRPRGGERHQPVEAWKRMEVGSVRVRD